MMSDKYYNPNVSEDILQRFIIIIIINNNTNNNTLFIL